MYVYGGLVAKSCPTMLLRLWNSPGKNSGVGCYSLLQGIFPTQSWNPSLLHYREILYCLSHQESLISISISIYLSICIYLSIYIYKTLQPVIYVYKTLRPIITVYTFFSIDFVWGHKTSLNILRKLALLHTYLWTEWSFTQKAITKYNF